MIAIYLCLFLLMFLNFFFSVYIYVEQKENRKNDDRRYEHLSKNFKHLKDISNYAKQNNF